MLARSAVSEEAEVAWSFFAFLIKGDPMSEVMLMPSRAHTVGGTAISIAVTGSVCARAMAMVPSAATMTIVHVSI